MAHSLPLSTSFQADRTLISNYVASRGHAETSPEIDQHAAASGVSSSPNALFSQQTSTGFVIRPVPTMGSSVSHFPDAKLAKDVDEPSNSRDMHSNSNNGPNITETTPLISNGRDNSSQDDLDWWTELWVLSSYTLPVYG
jgi:hypothetical protein